MSELHGYVHRLNFELIIKERIVWGEVKGGKLRVAFTLTGLGYVIY